MPRGIPNKKAASVAAAFEADAKKTKTSATKKRRKRRKARVPRGAKILSGPAITGGSVAIPMSMEDLGTVVGRAVREVLKT